MNEVYESLGNADDCQLRVSLQKGVKRGISFDYIVLLWTAITDKS